MTKTPQNTQETIGIRALATMTNLTPRRLHQLAQERRIPTPNDGQWPMADTIQALFRYYQHTSEEYSRERVLKLAAQRKRAELDLERARGKLADKSEFAQAIYRILGPARQHLEDKLVNQYPSVVSGLDPAAIRTYSRRLMDDLLQKIQQLGAEFDKL